MRKISLRPRTLYVFRATTRVAGLSWKTRANQFWLFPAEERGRRGRGFWVALGGGMEGGKFVLVGVKGESASIGSGSAR